MIGADAPAVTAALGRFVDRPRSDPLLEACGSELQRLCHQASVEAGWWSTRDGLDMVGIIRHPAGAFEAMVAQALVSQKLCLVHSEVSEALEGFRRSKADEHLPHRSSVEVELADAVIRIADLAGALGLDLGGAIREKMAFNAQRADHKREAREAAGGKAF